MESQEISYVMKPFDPKKEGEWVGYTSNRDIFLEMYIEKKYGNDMHYLKFIELGVINTEYSRKIHYKNLFLLNDYSIKIKNGEYDHWFLQNPNNSIPERYFEMFRNTKKRFTFYPLYFMNDYGSHAMMFLYDKNNNEIELFDTNSRYKEIIRTNKKDFMNFFNKIYGNDVIIVLDLKLYKKIGSIDYKRCFMKNYIFKTSGFCIIYVLWYLELRLRNKHLDRTTVISKVTNYLKNDKNYYLICDLLRGYADFVNETVKDYKILIKNNVKIKIIKKSLIKLKKTIKNNNNIKHKRQLTKLVNTINFINILKKISKEKN